MSHNYVKKMKVLDSANATTIYTVPDTKTAFLNAFRVVETSNNATSHTLTVTDSSANVFAVWTNVALTAFNEGDVIPRNLVLNQGDVVKFTATDANRITIHASFLERDQGVNNTFVAHRKDHTSSGNATIYTVPTGKKAIVNSIILSNDHASSTSGTTYAKFADSSDNEFSYAIGAVAAETAVELCARPQIMDEGEYIIVSPNTANTLHSHASVLEISNPG